MPLLLLTIIRLLVLSNRVQKVRQYIFWDLVLQYTTLSLFALFITLTIHGNAISCFYFSLSIHSFL